MACPGNSIAKQSEGRAGEKYLPLGGRVRKPRAVEDQSAPIPEERTKEKDGVIAHTHHIKATPKLHALRQPSLLHPVALLVFFPAAAGAGVVAADFVVASLNRLRCEWLFSAIEDEWGLGA